MSIQILNLTPILYLIMQILEVIFNLTPYYGPGLGTYNWSGVIGGCGPIADETNVDLLVVITVRLSIILTIIVITSVWTFLFTFGFLKKTLKRHEAMLNSENLDIQKHIYTKRVKNLIGIFGALFLSNTLCWFPIMVLNFISIIYSLPPALGVANLILYLFNNVTNPVVQIYFRKEFSDSLNGMFKKMCLWIKKDKYSSHNCCHRHRDQTITSQLNQANPSAQVSGDNCFSNSRHGACDKKFPKKRPSQQRLMQIELQESGDKINTNSNPTEYK